MEKTIRKIDVGRHHPIFPNQIVKSRKKSHLIYFKEMHRIQAIFQLISSLFRRDKILSNILLKTCSKLFSREWFRSNWLEVVAALRGR